MMNNCLLTAYWCVCISLSLRRGREVGQSGSSVYSPLRAAWLLQLSVQLQKGRLGKGGVKARQRDSRGKEDKPKKRERDRKTEMEKKLKEMRKDLNKTQRQEKSKRQAVEAKRVSERMRLRAGSQDSRDRERQIRVTRDFMKQKEINVKGYQGERKKNRLGRETGRSEATQSR